MVSTMLLLEGLLPSFEFFTTLSIKIHTSLGHHGVKNSPQSESADLFVHENMLALDSSSSSSPKKSLVELNQAIIS